MSKSVFPGNGQRGLVDLELEVTSRMTLVVDADVRANGIRLKDNFLQLKDN